jgi:signal transduction histidine kinase
MGAVAEARMAVLAELAFGAAHTLNNALTAIGGEASFLKGESKDPQVGEGCGLILAQVERCARLTHALLRRRAPLAAAPRECELGRVLRDVEALLHDSLPRRLALAVETCDESVLLALSADEAETLVLLLVQRAAFRLGGAGSLSLVAPPPEAGPHARLELRARASEPLAPAPELHERLLEGVLAAVGGSLVLEPREGEASVSVRLPRLS